MTLTPGLHLNIPADVYHADPCPEPSLNQTLAKLLVPGNKTPAHVRHAHPRLNPNYEAKHETKFSLGSAAHKLLLGRGRDFEVFDAADWNASGGGKGAKTELHTNRDAALAAGKLPILRHQHETAVEMFHAARDQLDLHAAYQDAFINGSAEVVAIAEHQGCWYRTMIDWRMPSGRILYDYKTTETSAAEAALQWRVGGEEWPIQAALQEFILDQIEPENAGRREFRNVCQEAYPPYALTVGRMPEATLHIARRKLSMAMARWQLCMSTGQWPAYEPGIVELVYPPHVAARWMEQEMREAGE
jgi:hypothetical protein